MCAILSRGLLTLFKAQYMLLADIEITKHYFQDILHEESEASRRKLRHHKQENKRKNQNKIILKDTSISFLGAEYDSQVYDNFLESV